MESEVEPKLKTAWYTSELQLQRQKIHLSCKISLLFCFLFSFEILNQILKSAKPVCVGTELQKGDVGATVYMAAGLLPGVWVLEFLNIVCRT